MTEFEFPDDTWEDMPPQTYCKCGQSSILTEQTQAGFKYSIRIKCPACGFWTNAVPTVSE